MPQIVYTPQAIEDLTICRDFLLKATTNPTLANEAMVHITDSLALLNNAPKLGRYYDNRRQLREYIIRFGRNAYLALYDYNEDKELVSILPIKPPS